LCLITADALPLPLRRTRSGRVDKPKKSDTKIERIFLTFQEAQEFFGVSHQTLYKLMHQGLASHKIGKKRVFLKEDLIQWIKDH